MTRLSFLVLLGLVPVVGCSSSKTAPVSGTVTLDGQPLANVAVLFQPIGEGQLNPGAGSSGRTNDKGEFTLTVIGGGNGAVLGKHRVEIRPTVDTNPDDERKVVVKAKVPTKYYAKSELTFEVKPGDNNATFALTSK